MSTKKDKGECKVIGCIGCIGRTADKYCKKHREQMNKSFKKNIYERLIKNIHNGDEGGGSNFNGDWDY